MGTLSQGCLTFVQNSNLVGTNKQSPRAMSLPILGSYQNPLEFCSGFSSQKKYRINTTGSNSDQFIEPLPPDLVTETDLEVSDLEVTDLDVKIRTASMVVPMEESVRRTMFLSNIDQALNIPMGVILFFKDNPNFTPDVITRKLEVAFRRLLVHYDFLAGRLRWNPQKARLEIDCNSAGAGFVTASSKLSMADIGDLLCPTPAFEQLLTLKWDENGLDDQPIFILQVTSFKCGGIALGVVFNHTTLDGISLQLVLQNLASLAANNHDLPFPPCNNRHILQVSTPPRLSLADVGLMEHGQKTSLGYNASIQSLPVEPASDNLHPKVFHRSAEDIRNLKERGSMVHGNSTNASKFSSSIISSFHVITAHVWRCMALTNYNGEDKEKASVILFPVNVRSRLQPPLPVSYTGNAILYGYGRVTYRELEEKPFSYLVEQVAEGVKRMNDEYIRSNIDWRELGSRYDVFLTPWWKLGFNNVEFPWGKPKCVCSVPHKWSKYVVVLEDNREVNNEGLNVFVSLPRKELDKFQSLFYQFAS